jgi:hypothetical protein
MPPKANQGRPRPPWPAVVLIASLVAVLGVGARVLGIRLDPTEDVFAVTLKNDTGSAVLLKQCDVKCDSFHEQDRLAPDGSVRVNTSSEDAPNWWVVEDGSGRSLGCLNLRYSHKATGVIVNVSATVGCPR